MAELRICSTNVRGLRDGKKRKELFNFLKKKSSDVYCLQETHSTCEDTHLYQLQWGGQVYFSHGTSQSRGVCIMVSNKIKQYVTQSFTDDKGCYVAIVVKLQNREILIVNNYTPNEDDPRYFTELFKQINEMLISEIVICGDFNLVLNAELDRLDSQRYKPKVHKALSECIDQFELLDIWRCRNPTKKYFSWSREKSNKKLSASRIDCLLLTPGLANCTMEVY